jgi:hypothetical protein
MVALCMRRSEIIPRQTSIASLALELISADAAGKDHCILSII